MLVMGIQEAPKLHHWNYFLALEEDVIRLSRYLEFTQDNFGAYSLELARILLAAASEVDVVAKRLCSTLEGGEKAGSIDKYRQVLTAAFPQLGGIEVRMARFGLTLVPWEQWAEGRKPVWWEAYTNVKHHRHTHFADASLKNTLNALAGLFVVILLFYREKGRHGQLFPNLSIFHPGPPFQIDYLMWGGERRLVYELPPAVPEGNGQ